MRSTILTCALLWLALAGCKREVALKPAAATPPVAAEASAPPAASTSPATAEIPVLKLDTVDGRSYELAAHRGRWVVVNFWATWCAPCLKEMPELSEFDKTREHVEIIGLAYEEIEPRAMRAFLKSHPVVYPVAIVDVYDPPADFPAPRGLPMTYLIAPDGKVAKQFLGPVTARQIETAIAAAGGPKAQV